MTQFCTILTAEIMYKNITTDIDLAVQQLQAGNLVAFPTETVYGLGADATNEAAIRKVFATKGRPADHPLIVHIAKAAQLTDWAINIPPLAWVLAEQFWPGPLTLLLTKHPAVSPLITGGQDSIALRIPQHKMALQLLQQFGTGMVGPSANKYGFVSPTTAQHVAADLGESVCILDGGPCTVGIESTIINLTADPITIMRQGAVTAEQIAKLLGKTVSTANEKSASIRVSGSHESHYAPRTPVFVLDIGAITLKIASIIAQGQNCSIISFKPRPEGLNPTVYWQQIDEDPVQYAHDLYSNLRSHDLRNNAAILIEKVPNIGDWAAISDRLRRAEVKG